jgi:hypothetical protein
VAAFPQGSTGAANAEQAVIGMTSLLQLVLDNKKAIQELELQLLPKGPEIFVQAPTLPQTPVPGKRATTTVIAVLASGFGLLLFVFIRKALENAGTHPDSAAKIARIRQAFGFSVKSS